jgi:hypothetical protein
VGADNEMCESEELKMPLRFLRDEVVDDPAFIAETQQMNRDFDWLARHSPELSEQFAGMYVAIAYEEAYPAATREEAYQLAKEKHPDYEPLVFHFPAERRIMIYDLSR